MANHPSGGVSGFFEKIAPGGKYYKYSLAALAVFGLGLLTLLIMIFLPILTGGKFQNPLSKKFSEQISPQPTPFPAPTPCTDYPIPAGKQTYEYSRGEGAVGPKIQTASFEPLDAALGQQQTITLTIKNESPITFAAVTLIGDGKEQTQNLKLINGTDTDGTWQIAWKVKNSFKCSYSFKFDLRSSTGNYNNALIIK